MQYRPFVLPRRFRKLTHVLLRANERTFYSIRTEQMLCSPSVKRLWRLEIGWVGA